MKIGSALSVAATALVFLCGGGEPLEGAPPPPKRKQNKTEPAPPQRGAEDAPLFIKGEIATKKTDAESQAEEKERLEKRVIEKTTVEYAGWAVVVAALALLVAGGQLWMFRKQLALMKHAATEAERVATAAQSSANAAETNARAVMLAERAYVKMSHVPPGIKWSETSEITFMVDVKVLNYGRTPTTVTDVVLCAVVLPDDESLPEQPSYTIRPREEVPGGFLMPRDYFIRTESCGLLGGKLQAVKSGASKLYVLGYVDYIDVFKQRHRNGYARMYSVWRDGNGQNNLVLVTQAGYNYDRPREKGEGNDWGE